MTGKLWPATVLPSDVMFHPDIPSASGGPAIGGGEQVVFSSAGRWKASLTMSVRRTFTANPRGRIRAARAMLAYMKGRSNTIYIGPYDDANGPAALAGAGQGYVTGITHSDGTLFSDGTGYAQYRAPAVVTSGAAKGALSATVTMLASGQVAEAGQYFGLGPSELYLIDTSVPLGGGQFALTFWPTLRSDHAANETVDFDEPTCEMRFATDDSGQLKFPLGFGADMALDLVEAL